jgi:hypothetical protein
MSDHERIWLEPDRGDFGEEGRMWCQDEVWEDGVEYVRADLASMTPSNAKDDAGVTELRAALLRIVMEGTDLGATPLDTTMTHAAQIADKALREYAARKGWA